MKENLKNFIFESRPSAKELQVKKLKSYLPEYKGYWIILKEYLINGSDPYDVRLATYKVELDKLYNKFRGERAAEFISKKYDKSVTHSCTKGRGRRGTKNCKWRFVGGGHPSLYTTQEWLKTSGQYKKISVFNDGALAGIYQTKSSSGTIKGTVYATFRYRTNFIDMYVEEDLTDLFEEIVDEELKEISYKDNLPIILKFN